MITKELVDRINYLAKRQRDGGLTEAEKKEQKALREVYLQNIRSQVVDAMESAGFKKKERHSHSCGCSDCSEVKEDPCTCGSTHPKDGEGACGCGNHGPGPEKLLH
jgi:hypothetical protein